MKRNFLKTLILTTIMVIATQAYCVAEELEEVITLAVSPTFTIQKKASSIESATMNPENGVHTGLQLVYDLSTNGTDDDYDITVTSSIVSDSGVVSAFGNDGSLLFAHETIPPTAAAITNAALRMPNNPNVIAYPVTASITSPMTTAFYGGYKSYGSCYVLLLNGASSGTLNFAVGTTPSASTYNVGRDESGSYKSTVTITVTPKS